MRFHGVSFGSQHEIWSKQHNGKVRPYWLRSRNAMDKYGLTDMVVQRGTPRQNVDAGTRQDRHVSPGHRRYFALLGSVLSLLFLLVMQTLAAPPVPTSPQDKTVGRRLVSKSQRGSTRSEGRHCHHYHGNLTFPYRNFSKYGC